MTIFSLAGNLVFKAAANVFRAKGWRVRVKKSRSYKSDNKIIVRLPWRVKMTTEVFVDML